MIPVVPCTPDHCGQTDVPMCFRTHSPRTCLQTKVRTEYWTRDGQTAVVNVRADETVVVAYELLKQMVTEFGFTKDAPH